MLTKRNYDGLIQSMDKGTLISNFPEELLSLWSDDYYQRFPKSRLFVVRQNEFGAFFSYLFDLTMERTLGACGSPILIQNKRDAGRMAGHPRTGGVQYDRGHLMAHSIGGGADINLVPQLSKLNRGEFRKLEIEVRKNAEENRTCLYWVRPIYTGESEIPAQFEQGLLYPDGNLLYKFHGTA